MSRPIVIGGCPGSGKTTLSRRLADHFENAVVVESDNFFDYLHSPLDPSLPISKAQNETVINSYTAAANIYRMGGYDVILEGVIGPWVFPIILSSLEAFDYVVLHTALETACDRVMDRGSDSGILKKVERMHPQFETILPAYEQNTINTEEHSVDEVIRQILERRRSGFLEIPCA